ncbi:MAG: DUF1801 domain-containing protein [Calditrichaeota bacterium]|nr:MAG: DUF1801 domain-containing protein [Calditrichota bacterium]
MRIEASSPEDYLAQLPEERRIAVSRLRDIIRQKIPEGFEETMLYGMIAYAVPLSRYPAGYHVRPNEPLPFINLASQKNHIALYHMGLYADQALLDWFLDAWPRHSQSRPDMGKSCVRFKNPRTIPFALIEQLIPKMSCDRWIALYEARIKKGTR